MPTAETSPEGSVTFTDYEIVVFQVGYAPSDRTQVTLTGAPPLGDERVVPLDFSAKTVVLREPRVSLALMGSASGIFGLEEGNGFVGRAGAVVTFCEPAWTCRLGLSMATNVALIGPASVALTGFGGSFRIGKLVSLVAEFDTAVPLGPQIGEANGILGGAGVRLSKATWGVDLGFFAGGKAGTPVVAVPWLAFSYRML
ncbi:MAG TPA: hypothetical protein VFZ53_32195 [Polyangiaceae bacterium]